MNYSFGEFRIDTQRHELTRAGVAVPIESRPFAALAMLVEGRDTVISKDELVVQLWDGRHTSDAAIASLMKKVRQAIGDDGKSQQLIRTIHGVGYRFVATVSGGDVIRSTEMPSIGSDADAASLRDTRPTLLVTPIVPRSDAAAASALPLGLTHDVIVGLSRLRWLKVIAWASALQLRGQREPQQDLHSLTAADYCIDGEIEQRGERIVLNCRLTRLTDYVVLWAERFEGRPGDFNSMRENIVQEAVLALELQISAAEADRARYLHTADLDAWGHYHLGLMHMYRFTAPDNDQATVHFERAIAQQPDFARAHAGLSFALFQSAFNRYPGADEAACRAGARRHAERGVTLDARDPLTNFVMGRSFWLEGDIEDCQPWLERALALNNSFAQAYYSHGLTNLLLDDSAAVPGDSHAEASAAISLSPLDPFTYGFYGVRALSYVRDGQLEQGRYWANRGARQPNAIVMMDFIAAVANQLDGDHEQALRWAARAKERSNNGNSDFFFRSLAFRDGPLRSTMEGAFRQLGIGSGQ